MFLFFIFMLGVLCGCPEFLVFILSLVFAGVILVVIFGGLYLALFVLGEFILLPFFTFIDSYQWMQNMFFSFLVLGVIGMYWKLIRDCRKECKEREEYEEQKAREIEKYEKELGIWKDKT